MKKLINLLPCLTLTLAAGAFNAGCANSEKCESTDACCEEKADCCKKGGDCKDDATASGAPAASSAPVNKMCPIGGHDANPNLTASYQGKSIAFCCDDCKQEFLGMDDAGKASLLAKATGN